jgi:hypothetical protein
MRVHADMDVRAPSDQSVLNLRYLWNLCLPASEIPTRSLYPIQCFVHP